MIDYFKRVFGIIVAYFSELFAYVTRGEKNNVAPARGAGYSARRVRAPQRSLNPILFGRGKNYLHFLFFPLAFAWFELWLRVFSGASFFRLLLYPLLFGALFGFFVSLITVIFKKNINRIIGLIILILAAVFFTTESILRESFNNYMPLGMILRRTGNVMQDYLWETIVSIFAGIPKIILFFIPVAIYFFFGKRYIPALRFHMDFVGAFLIVFLVLNLILSLFASGVPVYKKEYEFDEATRSLGLITSTKLDIRQSIFGGTGGDDGFIIEPSKTTEPSKTEESSKISSAVEPSVSGSTTEPSQVKPVVTGNNVMNLDFDALAASEKNETIKKIDQYVASLTPTKKNEYTGLFKGKNLIIIAAESYNDAFITKEATPTLWRLTHNGFYFTDFYQPAWGGSTSTGEFSILLGLSPRGADEAILDTIGDNNYFTMGNQLQRLGYSTRAYHNGSYDYYDRDKTHKNLGFTTFEAQGNGLEKIAGAWVSDDVMFDKTMDVYLTDQPFCTYYMTVSGHAKYTKDHAKTKRFIEYVREKYGNTYKDTTLYYICYQMHLEEALKIMLEKLDAAGILDDTVIAMATDHYPYGLMKSHNWGNTQDYFKDLIKRDHDLCWDRDKNGLVLWSGCLEHENKDMAKTITDPVTSLDILPTLSNLFGLEYDSRLLVGRDVFSDSEPLVFWNNYSWITRRGKYNSSEKKFYPNPGFENTDQAYIDSISAMVKNKITYSRWVVDNDYFGKLFGPDDIK